MYDMSSKSCVLHRLFLSRTETLRNASCIDPIIFIDKILHSILTHILKNISPFDFSSSYVVCQFRLDTFGGFPLSCIPPINPSSRYKVKLCRSRPDSSFHIFFQPSCSLFTFLYCPSYGPILSRSLLPTPFSRIGYERRKPTLKASRKGSKQWL